VVRVIDHPGMANAARQVVKRFGLSGFCGMDFLIAADGEAYMVELNPRVTPTCTCWSRAGTGWGRC
jgi:predicted ATP-grasp superfamily ATP-dependent carboligase